MKSRDHQLIMSNKTQIQSKLSLPLLSIFSKSSILTASNASPSWFYTAFPITRTTTKIASFPLPPFSYLVGLGLTVVFLLQALWQLHWDWLMTLQQNELYQQWSGLLLAFYLAGQFLLPLARRYGNRQLQRRYYHWHHWQGAFAPLIYYFHSMRIGYAYLLVLSIVYFANILVGLFSAEVVRKYVTFRHYSYYWLIVHISLSLLTVALVVYHIYIVLAYS